MAAKRVFKTTQKLSGGQQTYRKWEEWTVGDVLIGKYISDHTDQYDKVCPVFEVIDAQFKDGSGDKLEGKNLCLNNCGMLAKAMGKATLGDTLQVTYNGTSTIEKGKYAGKDSHVMEILTVEEDDGSETPEL